MDIEKPADTSRSSFREEANYSPSACMKGHSLGMDRPEVRALAVMFMTGNMADQFLTCQSRPHQ